MHKLPENDDELTRMAAQAMFIGVALLAGIAFVFGFILGWFL